MVILLPLSLLLLYFSAASQAQESGTCSASQSSAIYEPDPALHEMTYNVGDGQQKTLVYIEPDVTTFYKGEPPAKNKVTPKFTGLAGKFINMSNKRVSLYWEESEGGTKHEMRHHLPFAASGTATFPGHRFVFSEEGNPDKVLKRFIVEKYPENVYYYDPYYVEGDPQKTEENLKVLNSKERVMYDDWRKTLSFNEQYKNVTGRSYLANYLRGRPIHYMWRADYFGQEHWVTTKETHFVQNPPGDLLEPILATEGRLLSDEEPRILQKYRDPEQVFLNMTLRVLSCVPRVFEIENFMSSVEVEHILDLAAGIDLQLSSTGESRRAGERKVKEDTRRTRTSYNSWVPREKSPIIDAIYRRAADLLRIDEALFRHRQAEEHPEIKTKGTLAEQLQLVHYDVSQQYTAHHDFGYAHIDDKQQGARFATLLLYLNEGMKGGETSFPRWGNAETFKGLDVKPDKIGKAVLFYSQLPDGNLDDFSEHAAKPVIEGDKWLINLWVHDPIYEKE